MNQQSTKDILGRFSCFLGASGKRNCGHKILLESLSIFRDINDLNLLLKDKIEKSENFSSQKKAKPNKSKMGPQEEFENQGETINQFLRLPFVSLSNDNRKKTVTVSQDNQQFEKTLRKKVIVKKSQQERLKADHELFLPKSILSKSLCFQSIENVKPILETRKIRKGRMTYKVPLVTSSKRQEGKAISLVIENANFRRKNESKRSGSSFSENDSMLHKTISGDNIQNKSNFSVPLLYSWQISTNQPISNTSFDNKLLILPSDNLPTANPYQSINNHRKKRLSNEKQSDSQSKFSKKESIDKNIFFTLPERKHFLSFLRKPNIKHCLSEEFFDTINGKGGSIEKKKQLHNLALQNRAYQHFRWW